ncbi:alkaline-phosphatase-like protein, partial [Choanephora cucurbitarum]
MQRVKGLMTGSLPTFIDAGSNFASSAVGEDHLLNHIQRHYPNIYLMGDDTWVSLFPSIFHQPNRTFDSDSFKMLDLDSVDNHILTHLWPTLEKSDDWQFLVAHFLGVDHCGHTHGPSDPHMERKLNQMNGVIERLLKYVDQDTLLVVMGDHGMSVEGDHGGESVEELMSTLFLYSERSLGTSDPYFQQLNHRIHQSRAKQLDYDLDTISQRLSYDAHQYPVVAQIHLVPTLAYLLQVPIPFGNLGALIPDVLTSDQQSGRHRVLLHMVEQFRMNALQVYDYLEKYAASTRQLDFSLAKLSPLKQHLYRADAQMLELFQNNQFLQQLDSEQDTYLQQLEEALFAYDAFLISTIKYCESIWAQFDTGCMALGIVLLGASLVTALMLVIQHGLKTSSLSLCLTLCPILTVGLLITYARHTLLDDWIIQQGWFEKMEWSDWIGASLALTLCSLVFHLKVDLSRIQHSAFWRKVDWPMLLLISLLQSSTLGSNSFVVWEDRGTVFVLGTLCLIWMIRNLSSTPQWHTLPVLQAVGPPLAFFVLVRLTSMTGQCREEQFPYCDYFHSGQLIFEQSERGYITFALLIITFTLLVH